MISILLRLILASLMLTFASAASNAQNSTELGGAVPGHADITYLDLARLVIPDLALNGKGFYHGGLPIEMRHIEGPDGGGSPPETADLSNALVTPIRAGGKERLAMLFDLGDSSDSAEGYAVLALYDLTGKKPRLLDAVNVAVDRSTSFYDPGKLSVGAKDDVLITTSTHFNSNQGYVATPLMMVRNDRFELVDLIYTFNENLCAFRRTQDLTFSAKQNGRRHADIKATVTDTTQPSGENCGDDPAPKAATKTISVTYRWNAKRSRYVKNSKAFERLSAENAERF